MGDIHENSMTREAQQVYSELAQFGKPRGPDLPLCRRLSPLALRCANLRCHLTVANVLCGWLPRCKEFSTP
jgi:hypothetical protein